MKNWIFFNNGRWWRCMCFLLGSMIPIMIRAQCPLDISQTVTAPVQDLLVYFPWNGDLKNAGQLELDIMAHQTDFHYGICGTGLLFNGADSYIQLSPIPNIKDDFTFTAWISPVEQLAPMGIFSVRDQCETSFRGNALAQLNFNEYQHTGLNYQVNKQEDCTGWSGGDRYINPGVQVPDNEFSFIALTVSRNREEDRAVRFYHDCQAFDTEMSLNMETGQIFELQGNFVATVGASSNIAPFIHAFHGTIDEVRLYERVLTEEEIWQVYRDCMVLEIDINSFPACEDNSPLVKLYHTEKEVVYQLYDITHNRLVDSPQQGECGELWFYDQNQGETTLYQVRATQTLSGCSIMLDTLITVYWLDDLVSDLQEWRICEGDSVWWKDQFIYEEGMYMDTIISFTGCDTLLQTTLYVDAAPVFDFGDDLLLCEGESVRLQVPVEGVICQWQDGHIGDSYTADSEGLYYVKLSNACGESGDSIQLRFQPCCEWICPNVFTPNEDGINDMFVPVWNVDDCRFIQAFEMRVFDRWGNLLFFTSEPRDGWKGMFGDEPAEAGLYVWLIRYEEGGIAKTICGDVLLAR